MYFGRVYYYAGGLNLSPIHFDEFQTWVEEKEWYDSYGDIQYGGGYWKTTKTIKVARSCPAGIINIVENFRALTRDVLEMENWDLPACKVWVDTLKKWW
jgi:hypothetical protein